MKNSTLSLSTGLLALLVTAGSSHAQRAGQERLVELRQKKLKSAFLSKAAWQSDFDAAQAVASKRKQYIFAYFTRSFAP